MSLPEIQRIKDMYMGKRKPSSHILETNTSLSVSLALCSAFCQQDTEAQSITVFLLPVLGAGEDPDSMAIKILQGGSAGN